MATKTKQKLAAKEHEAKSLMWAEKDLPNRMTWADGKEACAALRDGGFSDWRMPTLEELETRRDLTRFNPAADPASGMKPNFYWSSTPYAASPSDCAWLVDFHGGLCPYGYQHGKFFVRAVRSAGQ